MGKRFCKKIRPKLLQKKLLILAIILVALQALYFPTTMGLIILLVLVLALVIREFFN